MLKSNIEYLKGIIYIAYKRKCKAVIIYFWPVKIQIRSKSCIVGMYCLLC